jgi:cell division protein FtsQ
VREETVRVRTDPRISRRRRAIARSRRRTLFVRGTAVLAAATLAYAAFWSPLLQVREVEVVGAEKTVTEEVVAITDLDEDANLLLVSTDEIARRAERLPWVRSAEVERILPGKVRVTVTERRPALALTVGAARWTIDRRGNVLAAGAGRRLPSLAGVELSGLEPGKRLEDAEIVAALRVFRSMPRPLRRRLVAIIAPTPERITLSLDDGTQIRYGDAKRMRAKNKVLRALRARLRRQQQTARYIDVRVPANPAVAVGD